MCFDDVWVSTVSWVRYGLSLTVSLLCEFSRCSDSHTVCLISAVAGVSSLLVCVCVCFSIMGAMRTSWYMFNMVRSHGLHESVCDNEFYSAPISKFWAFAFTLSKAPELGKTFTLTNNSSIIPLFFSEKIGTGGGITLKLYSLRNC